MTHELLRLGNPFGSLGRARHLANPGWDFETGVSVQRPCALS